MIDKNYKTLVEKVLNEGYLYDDPNRKNVKRLEIPSYTFRHNFSDGFPAISTKKLAWKSVVTELIWFLSGSTNIKYLVDNGCNIWNKDAYNYYVRQCKLNDIEPWTSEELIELIKSEGNIEHGNLLPYKLGDLGKVYGHYWRDFDGVDQITELINNMVNKPMSSELIVSARNPSHKEEQALPCCHYGFQVVVRPLSFLERIYFNGGISKIDYDNKWNEFYKLNKKHAKNDDKLRFLEEIGSPKYGFELHWQQRSCDLFLGKIWELLK